MPRPSRRGQFPQLGGEGVPYPVMSKETGEQKLSKAGNPVHALSFSYPDMSNANTRLAAHSVFAHSIETAPHSAIEEGKLWYPKVNEAVHKGIRTRGFLSGHADRVHAGAGIVAAVSPNMDWENANIGAFSELKSLKPAHWNQIMAKGDDKAAQAARDITRGMSISRAPLANLRKAGRIIHGEHPDTVLSERTAPKTNRFARNIADPTSPFVTIDGRAFDMLTNRARPWGAGRGISSAGGTRGTSRFEHSENIVKEVAGSMGLHPSEAQAISWVHGKQIERAGGYKQGPARRGQPYFDPHSGHPVLRG